MSTARGNEMSTARGNEMSTARGNESAAPPNDAAPDYLPARMLNEFVYCPRLFYYEWVEGIFAHNRETVEGAIRHAKLDAGKGDLTPAEDISPDESIHSRSVTLSSETYNLIAKLDVI